MRLNRHTVAEPLERRQLFTVELSLTNSLMLIQETNTAVNNFITIDLLDNGNLQVSELNGDNVTIDNDLANLGWTFGTNSDNGPTTGITQIQIDTFDGNDEVEISAIAIPTLIQPRGAAAQNIQLGVNGDPSGAQRITGAITFDGTHAKASSISFDDRLNPGNVDPLVTSTQVSGLTPAAVNFVPPSQTDVNGFSMSVTCALGASTSGIFLDQDPNNSSPISYQFDCDGTGTTGIEHLNANSQVQVIAHDGGTEQVRLGYIQQIATVLGKVSASGNNGSASMIVNDSKDTAGHTFETKSNGSQLQFIEDGRMVATLHSPSTGFTLMTGSGSNTVNLDLQSLDSGSTSELDCGAGSDTVSVTSLTTTAHLLIAGGGGSDQVTLLANAVQGPVTISNAKGSEAVRIDGSVISAAQVISLSDASVSGLGIGTYAFANLSSLSVVGGSGFDNISVTPSATVPITVDGGPAQGASTDRLDVNASQTTGISLQFGIDEPTIMGTYDFTNRKSISFTRFGTISPNIGDITGAVFNGQSAATVAGVTVSIDENNNGTADAGEPSTTTDGDGKFSFKSLPVGTFGLLISSNTFQLQSAKSVTVSGGVSSEALAVPVVPIVVLGGPDLSATILFTAAPGKGGSTKPKVRVKVTNAGASMATASALQVVLSSSTDNVLDPSDAQLAVITTPAVLLKANKSKVFSFSGSTSATLAKGNYFVIASVDVNNTVAESNEGNNVAASAAAVALAPSVADLTGKFGKLPKTVSAAKVLTVPVVMQNIGSIAATGTIDFDFVASSDQVLDANDISLGTHFPIAAHVAAGKSQSARFKLSINSLAAGNYFLVAKINTTSSVAESDLTNNTIFSAVPIVVG